MGESIATVEFDADRHAGTLDFVDGRVTLPDDVAHAKQYVIRTPWNTTVYQGRAITHYQSENPHVREGEVEIKVFGEAPALYRVVPENE